jgi:hypothetical protein
MLLTFESLRLFDYCLSIHCLPYRRHTAAPLQISVSHLCFRKLCSKQMRCVDIVRTFKVLELVEHIVTILLLGYWCVTCVEQVFESHHFSFSSGFYLPPELLLPLPWDSSVTVVTRLRAERSRFQIPSGARDFSLRQKSTPYLSPPSWVPRIVPLGKEGRWVRLNADPASGEVKNEWCYISTPPFVLSFHVQRQVSTLHCLYRLYISTALSYSISSISSV